VCVQVALGCAVPSGWTFGACPRPCPRWTQQPTDTSLQFLPSPDQAACPPRLAPVAAKMRSAKDRTCTAKINLVLSPALLFSPLLSLSSTHRHTQRDKEMWTQRQEERGEGSNRSGQPSKGDRTANDATITPLVFRWHSAPFTSLQVEERSPSMFSTSQKAHHV
jgi:hypothetical protein